MPRPKRPEIPYEMGERVEKFKRRHKNTSEKDWYVAVIKHLLNDDGTWKSHAPEELKRELGDEIAF